MLKIEHFVGERTKTHVSGNFTKCNGENPDDMGYHARRFSTRLARTPTLPGATVGDTLNSHLVVLNISKMYIDQMVDHSN